MPGLGVAQHGRRWLDSRDGRAGADHPPAPPRSRRAARRRRATVYIHEPSRSWTSASVLRHGGTRDRVGGYRPLKHGLPAGAGHMHTIRVPGQGSGIPSGRTFIPYLVSISAVRVPARAPSSRCWPASRRCNTRGSLALIVDDGRVRAGWLSLVAALPPRGRDPAACQGRSASHPPGGFTRPVSASRYSVSSSGLPAFRTCRSSSPGAPGDAPHGCLRCAVIFCLGCAMRAARWMAPVPSQQGPRCVWRRWITGVPVLSR